MKKILPIIALLGLAACGGGGGGSSSPVTPITPNIETNAANSQISSMYAAVNNSAARAAYVLTTNRTDLHNASQEAITAAFDEAEAFRQTLNDSATRLDIITDLATNDPEKLTRIMDLIGITDIPTDAASASSFATKMVHVRADYGTIKGYKLDTVNFTTDMGKTNDAIFNFIVDETGEITAMKYRGSGATEMARIDHENGNRFDNGLAIGDLMLTSEGKKLGLKYADFGKITVAKFTTGPQPFEDRDLYRGGYDMAQVELANADKGKTFTGTATGYVHTTGGTPDGEYAYLNGTATLTIDANDHKKQTLAMEFDNWNDATFVNDNGTVTASYENTVGKNVNNGIHMLGADISGQGRTITNAGTAKMDLDYYGVVKASEFVGMVEHVRQFAEHDDAADLSTTTFRAVVGGTKQ